MFSAIALDRKALPGSKRILLFHLTDTLASKTKYAGPAMKQLEAWGEGAVLRRLQER